MEKIKQQQTFLAASAMDAISASAPVVKPKNEKSHPLNDNDAISDDIDTLQAKLERGMLEAIASAKPGKRQVYIDEYRTFILAV